MRARDVARIALEHRRFAGMTDIHEMNALKSVLSVAINGVAVLGFITAGVITWQPGIVVGETKRDIQEIE